MVRAAVLVHRIVSFACAAVVVAGCTCRQPTRIEPSDAGAPTPAEPDASAFGCRDAEAHLVHAVGRVEATLGACEGDGDCVGDAVLVDCPRATFVECGFAYAGEHADEANERIDVAVETVCAQLDEPCEVRSLEGPDCPPSAVRCVDGRCRVLSAR